MKLQIVIAGVGGQGVLFTARLLYQLAHQRGENVFGSETHGMSQRGGSVLSHVKIGEFFSPLIKRGRADLLFGLQRDEGLRNLPMLREGGAALINSPSLPEVEGVRLYPVDADEIAQKLGNPRVANLILIGYAVSKGLLPFNEQEVREAVTMLTPIALREINLKAVQMGFEAGKEA